MATELLYFGNPEIGDVGDFWFNYAAIVGQYDGAFAETTPLDSNGDFIGGSVDDASHTPTSIDSFLVNFHDEDSLHSADVIFIEVNVGEGGGDVWEVLETFDSGNLLPLSATEFDYTTEMQTKFGAAGDATDFINGLQFRWHMPIKTKGGDSVVIGCRGIKLVYVFTAPPGARFSQAIIIT